MMMSMSPSVRLTIVGAVAALVSVLPLFDITETDGWIVSAAIAVAAVAATGYLLRKINVPVLLIPVAQLAVLILWLGALVAGDVALLGFIPTTEWGARLVEVFRDGVDAINTYVAPVPVPRGMLMILVGGAGLVALMVDVIAVSLRRVPWAGVALVACYTVAAAVPPDGLPWWWFLPPAAGYLALLVSEGRTRVAAWGRAASPSAAHAGVPETDSLARHGRRVSAVALAAAVAVPGMAPILTEGLLSGGRGSGGGGQTIRTDNPIVDLQRNLQRPDNVDVLTYTSSADEGTYVRMVTLDVFDGNVWKTSDRPVPDSVDGGLPWPQGLTPAELPVVDYDVEVNGNLDSTWLPMPYPAQEVDVTGDWRYHAETLDVVANGGDNAQGKSYHVRSLTVEPTVEALRRAPAQPSIDVEASLALPDDLPGIVAELATVITANATDDFGRAAALQEWFRGPEGGFVYDIESDSGHSASALEDFLTERVGYCEQFAASMAIMARVLDIPSRVAVGFTAGDYQEDATWLVRAHDMHSWPELYFEGLGWVPFEPTPAQRTGSPPDWTVVPSQTGEDAPNTDPSAPQPEQTPAAPDVPMADDLMGGSALPGDEPPSQWPLVIVGILAIAAFFSTPWLFARFGRALRWRRAGNDAAATAEAAWTDLREAVRDSGLPWDPAATPRAAGHRLATDAGLSRRDQARLEHLIDAVEHARYAPHAHSPSSLWTDAIVVRRNVLRSRPIGRRVQAFLLPSRLGDAASEANRRMADAFDWLDLAGERLRTTLTRVATRANE